MVYLHEMIGQTQHLRVEKKKGLYPFNIMYKHAFIHALYYNQENAKIQKGK